MRKMKEVKLVAKAPAISSDANEHSEMIVAKVPQGYETNINVRFVPGKDVDITLIPKVCRSRTGGPRRDAEPLELPPDLVVKLKKADKAVVAWLAQDEANARLFMVKPAEALSKAGVDLTRSEQKTIDRTHREVREATVVGPGVKVSSLKATAFPRGNIGKIKKDVQPKNRPNDKTGCVKEV